MNLKISIQKHGMIPFQGLKLFNLAKYFDFILNVH